MELANVELGIRLGLYEVLAGAGLLTAAELADGAGIAARYAREWLEQQAVEGVLVVDDTTTRSFSKMRRRTPSTGRWVTAPRAAPFRARWITRRVLPPTTVR